MRGLTGRGKSQRGNAVLELGLVLLPLMALTMAIVDFSVPIFLRSLFNHAVREGARYGITYRTEPGMTHSESIKTVVQRNAAGFLNGTPGLNRISVKFYSPDTFLEVLGPNANAGGNILEVSVLAYQWNWIAPIWRAAGTLNLNARSADRLETLPRGVARPAP
jgi:hypothetical protein